MKQYTDEAGQTSTPRRRRKMNREGCAEQLCNRIFAAAADVAGRLGYAHASINRFTEAAGIAQGTFYLYFEFRQTLFNELLPHVSNDLIAFLKKEVSAAGSFIEMEERRSQAFFCFLSANPASSGYSTRLK